MSLCQLHHWSFLPAGRDVPSKVEPREELSICSHSVPRHSSQQVLAKFLLIHSINIQARFLHGTRWKALPVYTQLCAWACICVGVSLCMGVCMLCTSEHVCMNMNICE